LLVTSTTYNSSELVSVVTATLLNMEEQEVVQGWSPLEESAMRLHELYLTFVKSGFTKDEALDLIVKAMNNKKT